MYDLFGDIIVTADDLQLWVAAVAPGFAISASRCAFYIERWDVVEKVRRAKLDGYFDSTIEKARERRAYLSRRFGLY
jgi:hypothetical protein